MSLLQKFPTSFLTFLLIFLVAGSSPFPFVNVVEGDTQMCRRFSRTAETTSTVPNMTSCIHMWVTAGRHYNSLNIYVEIDRRKSTTTSDNNANPSSSCVIPQGPFYLSLQVFNELGYPIGDPEIGFQKIRKANNFCNPPGTISYYDPKAELTLIPCFFDKLNRDSYKQETKPGYKPGVLALMTPAAADLSRDLFHFRATWRFSKKDLSKVDPRKLPKELYPVGELFDPINDKIIQFSALESFELKYVHGTVPIPKPLCDENHTIKRSLTKSAHNVFIVRTRAIYAKAARENLQEFEYSIPGVTLKPNQPQNEPELLLDDQYACRQLKRDVFRISESPESLKCIRLDVYPSRSGINQVRLRLSYVKGADKVLCKRWRPLEWLIEAYNSNTGRFNPSGSPVREKPRYPGSFYHYSGAGLTRLQYQCDISNTPNFIQMLEDFQNIPCPYHQEIQNILSQEVNSTTMPTISHTVSKEFFTSDQMDELSVWYIWKFMPPNDLDPSPKRPKLVDFMLEAYLPYQHLVLVMRSQEQVEMIRYSVTPPPGSKEPHFDDVCNSDDSGKDHWFKYTRNNGGSTLLPVRGLPDTLYIKNACDNDRRRCEDLQLQTYNRGNLLSCLVWRPEFPRYPPSDCFPPMQVHPGRQENSVLISFMVEIACLPQHDVEDFVIGAYNEEGFPVGKIGASFSPYDGQDRQQCKENFNWGIYAQIDEYHNYDCFYDAAHRNKFIQEVNETSMPTLFSGKLLYSVLKNSGKTYLMWRVIWEYEQPLNYVGKHPEEIFFMAELYLKKRSQVIAVPGENSMILNYVRSPKENPYADCVTNQPSPQNSVRTGPNKKDQPGDPDYVKNCKKDPVCLFTSVIPRTTTTTTTPKPLVPVLPAVPEPPVPIVPGGPAPPPEPLFPKKKFKKPSNVYEGCVERTKGCIVPPKGNNPRECLKKHTCDLVIAFQRQDMIDTKSNVKDFVVLEMYHQDPGEWFAIGLNPSLPRMADSYVVECVDEGDIGGPVIYNSRNLAGGKYENKRYPEDGLEGAHLIIDKQESYRRGREIYCRFHIKMQFRRSVGIEGTEKRFFDLQKMPFYIVATWGADYFAGPKGNLRRHKPSHFMRPQEGARYKTVLAARYAPSPAQKPLMVSHGIVMLWVVLFCLPVGSFIGRYLKETFSPLKICNRKIPIWLIFHVILMSVGVGLFIYAMWSEIEGHKKWVSLRKSNLHTWLGGVTGGLFLLNFFVGFASKVSKFGKLNPIGLVHGLIGHILFILSLVLVFRLDDVSFGNAPCMTKYIAGAQAFTYCVIYGVMAYHYRWVDLIVGIRAARGSFGIMPIEVLTERDVTELIELRRSREPNMREFIDDKNKDDAIIAPGRKVRVAGLALVTFLSLMYVVWTSLIIFYNQRGPCIPLDQFTD